MPLLPSLAVAVKHLIEFLICGCIGTYCVLRCAALMPRVIAEAHAVVRMAVERRREIEAIQEEAAQ
jgi:hypothetical protein